jgi:hypothetical protein
MGLCKHKHISFRWQCILPLFPIFTCKIKKREDEKLYCTVLYCTVLSCHLYVLSCHLYVLLCHLWFSVTEQPRFLLGVPHDFEILNTVVYNKQWERNSINLDRKTDSEVLLLVELGRVDKGSHTVSSVSVYLPFLPRSLSVQNSVFTVRNPLVGFGEKMSLLKFLVPEFYGNWKFITAFTSAHHLSLFWTSSIQSMPPHPTS